MFLKGLVDTSSHHLRDAQMNIIKCAKASGGEPNLGVQGASDSLTGSNLEFITVFGDVALAGRVGPD